MEQTLAREPQIEELARSLSHARDFLFLGRGINYPIALEGALKLKEISYIHAEGYPAGEMKHGPIALVDEELPVVGLCPQGPVHDKMLSNLQEAKARGGRVIAVATAGDAALRSLADGPGDCVIDLPPSPELLIPLLTVIPLQLLAYHVAVRAGPRRRPAPKPREVSDGGVVPARLRSARGHRWPCRTEPEQREAVRGISGPGPDPRRRRQREDPCHYAPRRLSRLERGVDPRTSSPLPSPTRRP